MKSQNYREERSPTGHLLSPDKTSSAGIRLHLIELLAKRVPWKPPNNPNYCQDCGLFFTNGWQGPVAEYNTCTNVWACRSRTGTYIRPSPLNALVQEDPLPATKGEVKTLTQLQTLWSAVVTWLQYELRQWWHKACERNQPKSGLT